MRFEWDEVKDAANLAKHGLSLGDAARLDWAGADVVPDGRSDYGEIRQIAYADVGGRLHTCVYTLRDDVHRIISLRKSNIREIRDHGTKTGAPPD